MSPHNHSTTHSTEVPATSPWTEPYQSSTYADAYTEATLWASHEDEAQRPTHDALSEVYNRGSE